jgi:hypothetical protein
MERAPHWFDERSTLVGWCLAAELTVDSSWETAAYLALGGWLSRDPSILAKSLGQLRRILANEANLKLPGAAELSAASFIQILQESSPDQLGVPLEQSLIPRIPMRRTERGASRKGER